MKKPAKKSPPAKKHAGTAKKPTEKDVERSLNALMERVKKVQNADPMRRQEHEVVFNLTGAVPGTFVMELGKPGAPSKISRKRTARLPTLEVSGDAEKIHKIIDGRIDARKAFLSGGIRIRGNLVLFEQFARDLGIL